MFKFRPTAGLFDDAFTELLNSMPGVRVRRGSVVECSDDVAPLIQKNLLGAQPFYRSTFRPRAIRDPSTVHGFDRLWPFQKEDVLRLAHGEIRGLWWATGLGKTPGILIALDLIHAGLTLIVTKGIGRERYAEDAGWAADRKVGLVIGHCGTEGGQEEARRTDKRLQLYRTRGTKCVAVNDAREAVKLGCDTLVVGWEVLAAAEKEADGKTVIRPRADLRELPIQVVVLDEHHLGKGRLSDRTQAATAISRSVSTAWSMTATPVADRLRDLHPQLACIAPEAWEKSDWRFVHYYAHSGPGRYGGLDTSGPHKFSECAFCRDHAEELKQRVVHWFSIRSRQGVADQLPNKGRVITHIPAREAAKMLASGKGSARGEHGWEGALAVAADVATAAAVDMAVEALIARQKVVVVGNRRAWVPRTLALIQQRVKKIRHVHDKLWIEGVTGETPIERRLGLCREYLCRPDTACVVATMDSIGTAINLHAKPVGETVGKGTDQLICAALPMTPYQVTQLEGRVSRIGGDTPVTIQYLVPEGTIAEEIERLLLKKLLAVEQVGADTEQVNFDPLQGMAESDVAAGLEAWLKEQAA